MELKYLGIFFTVLLLASFSFAAGPTVSDLVLSNSYTNDSKRPKLKRVSE